MVFYLFADEAEFAIDTAIYNRGGCLGNLIKNSFFKTLADIHCQSISGSDTGLTLKEISSMYFT